MERYKRQERESFFETILKAGILCGIALFLMGVAAPVCADESISISCYKDAKSGISLGSVVVFNVANAAQACNSTYYDCRGRCIGCYQDYDYIDNVCVDVRGSTFLK